MQRWNALANLMFFEAKLIKEHYRCLLKKAKYWRLELLDSQWDMIGKRYTVTEAFKNHMISFIPVSCFTAFQRSECIIFALLASTFTWFLNNPSKQGGLQPEIKRHTWNPNSNKRSEGKQQYLRDSDLEWYMFRGLQLMRYLMDGAGYLMYESICAKEDEWIWC